MRDKRTGFIKRKWWLVVAAIWFVASFFYADKIFVRGEVPSVRPLIQLNGETWGSFERLLTYICIRVIGLLLMMFLCYGADCIIRKRFHAPEIIGFTVSLAIWGLYTFIAYPTMYDIEPDAYTLFAYAIRNIPYYWHGVFTLFFFGGTYIVFPSPISLPVIQVILFSAVFGYGAKVLSKKTKKWWLLFGAFLLPEVFYVITELYRNSLCAILEIFLLWFITDKLASGEGKNDNLKTAVIISLLVAVLCAWRTEIIFVGVAVLGIYVFRFLKGKGRLISVAVFAVMYLFLHFADSIGTKNYYGRDYLIVNSMNSARELLADGRNLSYTGAAEDIAALEALNPEVRTTGIAGYRMVNEKAFRNINQSLAGEDAQNRYVKAYYRLALHNFDIYLKNQVNVMLRGLGSSAIYPLTYIGRPAEYFDGFMEDYYYFKDELAGKSSSKKWYNNDKRSRLYAFTNAKYEMIMRYVGATRIPVALRFFVPMLLLVKLFGLLFDFKNFRKNIPYVAIIATLFMQFGAIVAMMPEDRPAYFYAVTLGMYVVAVDLALMKKRS